jgi:hypothetical protein
MSTLRSRAGVVTRALTALAVPQADHAAFVEAVTTIGQHRQTAGRHTSALVYQHKSAPEIFCIPSVEENLRRLGQCGILFAKGE